MRQNSLAPLLIACLLLPIGVANATGDKKKTAVAHECANLKAEVLKAANDLTKLRDNSRRLRDAIARAERERDGLAAKLAAAEKVGGDRTKEIGELKKHHAAALGVLEKELLQANAAHAQLKAQRGETDALITKLRGDNEMLANELKAAWGRAKSAEARNKELASTEKEKVELLASLKKVQTELSEELTSVRTTLGREITELRIQLAAAKAEVAKAKSRPQPDTKKLEAALASSQRELAAVRNELATAHALLAKGGAAKEDCEKRVAVLKRQLAEAERTASALRDQLARESAARKNLDGRVAELEKIVAHRAPKAEPAPRPAPREKPAASAGDLVAVLHFGNGCCTTKRDREQAIERVRALLRKAPDTQFDIVGHTCNTGCAQANLCLSKCRAQYVRDTLVVAGIPPRILDTYGLGEEEPVADNRTEGGRRQNRRVEIKIYRPGALPPGY